MKTLVVAEHDNASLKAATLNAVAAAQAMGGEIDIVVAGAACDAAAAAAAQLPGVNKVVCADNAAYEHQLAENVSLLIAELGEGYDYAFVSGFNHDYLWLLARTPQISSTLREQFLKTITELGFDPAGLVWLDSPAESVASSQ